jgi:two-component system nitrate/nitrite response regulator NarL
MKLPSKIKLLLVDDHPLVRDGLKARLESIEHFEIVGEAGNQEDALQLTSSIAVDLILMDINLGRSSGIQLSAELLKRHPQISVVILSMHDRAEYVTQAIEAGARGYVSKDAPAEEIIEAINCVAAGASYFSSALKPEESTFKPNSPLTMREQCVLESIATGKSNKHIARELDLSVRTVETHRLNIKRKLNIEGQADLIRYALSQVRL